MNRDYFSQRSSIRKFTDQPIPDSLIEEMLEKAAHAPTTGNMQLYSVIITREEDKKKQLTPCHFNQPASTSATVLLTFCADLNRFVKWCKNNNAEPGFDNFQSFMSAVFDTVILAQQFCTIAEMNGLGTCYLGTTTYTAPQIAKILELPKRVIPILTIALGWPDENNKATDRINPSGFIHYEKYNDYTPEKISAIYDYKDKIDENINFIKENNKETLAQVFTDVRYPKENNETFSKVFIDYIKTMI